MSETECLEIFNHVLRWQEGSTQEYSFERVKSDHQETKQEEYHIYPTTIPMGQALDNETKAKLILPLVSTGNVPQLAVDLILHNPKSNFKFVQDLKSQYLLYPFVGSLDTCKDLKNYPENKKYPLYNSTKGKFYSSALELFHDSTSNTYIVQQRTPIITNFENNFFHELLNNDLASYNIQEVIILDSMGPMELENIVNYSNINSQFFSENDRISVGNVDLSLERLSKYFEETNLLLTESSSSSAFSGSSDPTEPVIDKTLLNFDSQCFQIGLNTTHQSFKLLYHILHHNSKARIQYVNMIVYEGDNSHDAGSMVKNLFTNKQMQMALPNDLIDWENLVPPLSWDGVYGFNNFSGSMDEGLYV
ncbi:hypothetical protein ACO0QE_004462 [Hanseniaspora vineae]